MAWSTVPKHCPHVGCGVARGRWAKQPPSLLLREARGSCELRPPAPALQMPVPAAQPQPPGWRAPNPALLAVLPWEEQPRACHQPWTDIASCPAHPCGHPCSWDRDGSRGPPQPQSQASSGWCLGDAPGACAQRRHSLGLAVPWHHPGQCHLLGEAGREGMGRDVRDWGSSTVAKWRRKLSAPPSPASRLRAVSTGARALAVLCSSPRWRPGKGNGAGWCHHIGHGICCQQRLRVAPACWHRPHCPPTARQGPCKVTASVGPCKAPRHREYLHPSLQHCQPSLLPSISTGQLFHLSAPQHLCRK